jgi:DNA end-binding protein Ku
VLFTPDELKALEEGSSHIVEITAFIPESAVDPIYYDKAYFLAPDKRGGKPYALLSEAMRKSGRCALAKWSWKAKQYVVQIRPAEDGLILQQLLYADEVRSMKELDIEKVSVSPAELQLALQLIDQISEDEYDPSQYQDEEKKRVLAAIDEKIAGKHIVASARTEETGGGGQVIDLMDALKASLGKKPRATPATPAAPTAPAAPGKTAAKTARGNVSPMFEAGERKSPKRAAKSEEPAATPTRARARKG